MRIAGHTALVTGAARRLGRHLALGLAAEGMAVAVHYHTSEREAEEVVAVIRAQGGRACAIAADLRDAAGAARVLDRAGRELGEVRVLVNNASIFRKAAIGAAEPADLREDLALHVESPYALARALAARLGPDAEGRVVNLLDWRASLPDPYYAAYSIGKAALLGATRALARSLAPRVTVNAIAPGAILPPVDGSGKGSGDYGADLPLARKGAPEDVVRACVYLVRDADYTTGAVLPVDGGRHLL